MSVSSNKEHFSLFGDQVFYLMLLNDDKYQIQRQKEQAKTNKQSKQIKTSLPTAHPQSL